MKTLLIALVAFLAGCTQPDKSRALLEANGYKSVEITGYNFFSCSEDDTFSTGFKAVGPTGQPVEGAVCAGWFFKGATIRFD